MSKRIKRKQKFSILSFLFFLITVIFLFCVVVGTVILFSVLKDVKPIDADSIETILNESSFLYDDEGNQTEKIQSNIYRTIVPIEEIPSDLQKAFIAIEDERFYEHNGVDIKRVFGAIYHDVKVGSLAQGASTIDMQLSKNLFTSADKSFKRKIIDMYYAIQLNRQMSKTQILHAYLNTVFLGDNVNGVQAAAKSYFSKNVSELNLAESAMIAGITKYPTRYLPYKTEKILSSDDIDNLEIKIYPVTEKVNPTEEDLNIYKRLYNNGKIDKFDYTLLKNGSTIVRKAVLNEHSKERQEIVLKKMLDLGWISNETYEKAVNTPIIIKFPPKGNRGLSSYFNDKVKSEVVRILVEKGSTEEKARDILQFGGLRIYTTLNRRIQSILEDEFEKNANFPPTYVDEDGVPQPQGAMVIMDQHLGQVKAMIGGRGQAGSMIYNRAVNPRQPGSSIKPIAVYLPALNQGMTPNTMIDDTPRKDSSSPTGVWPLNASRSYSGRGTMRRMVAMSSNVAAVRTMESLAKTKVGAAKESIEFMRNMGITTIVTRDMNPSHNDENLSLALGGMTKGISPLEMTAAFSAIANLGKYNAPTFITRIENANGDIIYEYKMQPKEISNPQSAYEMTSMLVTAVESGTGRSAAIPGYKVAGKTGTTSDKKDAWFVGYTPNYTAATWIGADMPRPMSEGSSIAARLWRRVMSRVQNGLPRTDFEVPKGSKPISNKDIIEEKPEDNVLIDPETEKEVSEQLFDDDYFVDPDEKENDDEDKENQGETPQEGTENGEAVENPEHNNDGKHQTEQGDKHNQQVPPDEVHHEEQPKPQPKPQPQPEPESPVLQPIEQPKPQPQPQPEHEENPVLDM